MSTSPFELFRRNLKPLMIALTVLAMLAFVVLPAVDNWVRKGGPGGGDGALVASYKGGQFDQTSVNKFTQNHYNTLQFLADLAKETAQLGGTINVPGFEYDEQNGQISQWGISSQPSATTSVSAQLYAQRAIDLGFDLDHSAVKIWLSRFSDNKLTDTQINQILRKATDRQLGQYDMLEQLRIHLLSNAVQQTSLAGLYASNRSTIPPSQQYAYYLRLNERAKAVAYPVLVDDYLAKTNDKPSEAEIQRVYDEGKEVYPDETSVKPGFRRPVSATFEVVSGNFETFIERLAAEVPEEKLKEEYDSQVATGGFVVPESSPDEDEPNMSEPPGEAPPNVSDETAPDQTPAEGEPADAAGDTEPPMTEQPATETPAEPAVEETPSEPAPETPTPETGDQSSRVLRSDLQLVAFRPQDESADEAPADEQPPADQPAEPADTPAEPTDAAEPAETTDPPAELPAASADNPAENTDPPVDAAGPDSEMTESTEDPTEPAKPPKIRPFEEVRDQIAEQLVTPDAFKKVQEGIAKVKDVMRKYSVDYAIYQADVEDDNAEAKAPQRPDIKALAEQLGLDYETIGPHDIMSIQDTDIGNSAVMSGQFQMGDTFPQIMFGGKEGIYSPVETTNFRSGQTFLSWKTEQTPDTIPLLIEARDEVISYIRYQEARELARQAAEELAAKANTSPDKPLVEIVPEDRQEFVYDDLGEFPWMLWLGPGRMPMVWNLETLNRAGDDFMRQVFTQPLNEFGVAPNETRSVYYVVKTTQRSPSAEELRSQFIQANERETVRGMMSQQTIELSQAYQREFREQLGLKWDIEE